MRPIGTLKDHAVTHGSGLSFPGTLSVYSIKLAIGCLSLVSISQRPTTKTCVAAAKEAKGVSSGGSGAGALHLHAKWALDPLLRLASSAHPRLNTTSNRAQCFLAQAHRFSRPCCTITAQALRSTSRASAWTPPVSPFQGRTHFWRRLLPLQRCWCSLGEHTSVLLAAQTVGRAGQGIRPKPPIFAQSSMPFSRLCLVPLWQHGNKPMRLVGGV